jgi:hypothetical protein
MNFIASRSFLSDCNYKIENPESESKRIPTSIPTKHGESIYIHSTALEQFANEILPHINVGFILYSGDSDRTIPDDCLSVCSTILINPHLLRWYAQNCTKTDNPKLIQLPIGLDLHTLAKGNHSWGPQQTKQQQVDQLIKLRSQTTEKKNKCYANFHFLMWTRYAQDRRDAIAKVSRELVFYEPHKVSRTISWNNMIQYKYVISPHGNGLDCHRTWEAIILGCIPIVKTSPLDTMFEGLPVLIVKDWSEVTQDLLDTFVPDMSRMDKITLSYWK